MEHSKNRAQAKALFALEKRMEAARRAALRPFNSRTAEEVERELAQLHAEYEAILASAAETPAARVEEAYAAATGRWNGADWEHESSVEADGTPVICDSATCATCATCAAAAEDAAAAEGAARAALEAAREGDGAAACAAARAAYELERTWGDTPTWGTYYATIAAAFGDEEDDEDDDEDDAEAASALDAYTTAEDVLVDAVCRAARGKASAALRSAADGLVAAIAAEVDVAGELRHGELSARALDAAEAAVVRAAADDDEVAL